MHPANALLALALAIPAVAYAAGAVEKKRDEAGRVFVRGPSVTPADALIAWLEREAGEQLVRGKNYTLTVYDIDAGIDTMTAFYESRLPAAKGVPGQQEVRFTTQGGTVRLARLDKGTRITLVVGPR